MSKLQNWMKRNEMDDASVARAVQLSRSQINRIRREETTASYDTSLKLEKLTGIRWWNFMAGRGS